MFLIHAFFMTSSHLHKNSHRGIHIYLIHVISHLTNLLHTKHLKYIYMFHNHVVYHLSTLLCKLHFLLHLLLYLNNKGFLNPLFFFHRYIISIPLHTMFYLLYGIFHVQIKVLFLFLPQLPLLTLQLPIIFYFLTL